MSNGQSRPTGPVWRSKGSGIGKVVAGPGRSGTYGPPGGVTVGRIGAEIVLKKAQTTLRKL